MNYNELGEFDHYHIRVFGFILNNFSIIFRKSDKDTFVPDTFRDRHF